MAANHLRMRDDSRHHTDQPARRSSSSGSGCTSSSPATTTRSWTTPTLLGSGHPAGRRHRRPHRPAARTVELASGDSLGYDYLIYAVGSTGAVPASRARRSRIRLSHTRTGAGERLRAGMADLPPDAPVSVVGAGLTGIEAATEFAEQGRTVTLVCGGRARAVPGRTGPSLGRQAAGASWASPCSRARRGHSRCARDRRRRRRRT